MKEHNFKDDGYKAFTVDVRNLNVRISDVLNNVPFPNCPYFIPLSDDLKSEGFRPVN